MSTGGDDGHALAEMLSITRKLNNRLQAMEACLGPIEQAVQQDPEIATLAGRVFDVPPTKSTVVDQQKHGLPAIEWKDPDRNEAVTVNLGKLICQKIRNYPPIRTPYGKLLGSKVSLEEQREAIEESIKVAHRRERRIHRQISTARWLRGER